MTAPQSGAAPEQPYGAVPSGRSEAPTGPPSPAQSTGQFPAAPPPGPALAQSPPGPAVAQPVGPPRPPVPPGSGVRPPFVAPPVRKEAGTLALGLILGGLVLLLCLVGGGIGLGGAVYTAMRETEEQVTVAATDYLDALVAERYADAYQMTCGLFRKKVPQQEYVTDKRRGVRLADYELRPITATQNGKLMVPVAVVSENGVWNTMGLVMVWEPADGSRDRGQQELRVRVCGEVDNPTPAPS